MGRERGLTFGFFWVVGGRRGGIGRGGGRGRVIW